MVNFGSITTASLVSLTAIPLVLVVTTDDVLSKPLYLMSIGFGFLAIIAVTLKLLLPPSGLKQSPDHLEKRGLLYYTCCVFMWSSIADLTIQSCHLQLIDCGPANIGYLLNGELYLSLPFGISTQMWNGIVHYILQAIIIFQIDNSWDCRITALLWSGSIITSQFAILIGSLSGSYSDKLEYASWMNAIYICMPVWILCRFLNKPIRNSSSKLPASKNNGLFDLLLYLLLLFSILFSIVRGLAALGSKLPLIANYVSKYEPGITDPAQFACSWVLYTAIYLAPFCFAIMYNFNQPVSQWVVNLSIYFAGGVLQGTFAYLSYSWYPSSEPKFRIPNDNFVVVMILNILLVVTAYMLMYRSLNKFGYFTKTKKNKPKKKKPKKKIDNSSNNSKKSN